MKWHIDSFRWKKYNKFVVEWYISGQDGNIKAGDFYSRKEAVRFIAKGGMTRRHNFNPGMCSY